VFAQPPLEVRLTTWAGLDVVLNDFSSTDNDGAQGGLASLRKTVPSRAKVEIRRQHAHHADCALLDNDRSIVVGLKGNQTQFPKRPVVRVSADYLASFKIC
jgi:hypothetical protein